jgi:hypothetical protein
MTQPSDFARQSDDSRCLRFVPAVRDADAAFGENLSHGPSLLAMPGLVPGIHVLLTRSRRKAWMAGTSPAMTIEVKTRCIDSSSFLPAPHFSRGRVRRQSVSLLITDL